MSNRSTSLRVFKMSLFIVLKSEMEQEIKSLKIRQVVGVFFFFLHLNLQLHPAELHHQSPFIQDGMVSSATQKGFDVSIEIFIPVLFVSVVFLLEAC